MTAAAGGLAGRLGRYGLGTAPLGGLFAPVSEEEAGQTLAAAWEAGIRYFDTAPHYGSGLAEERLGRFLRALPEAAAAEAVVSTKVGRVLVPGQGEEEGFPGRTGFVRVRDYSRDGVLRSLDDSLNRTGLDHFDLVFIHDPDDHWEQAAGQAYPALAELRDQGVIGAVGAGMNQAEMLTRFVRETDLDAVLVAGRYTLLDRSAAEELLPECERRGVAVIAGGVFNSGILAGGTTFNYDAAPPPVLERARGLGRVCASHGVPLPAAALRFPHRHPAVANVLIGARSAEEITEDLALAASDIPDALWEDLDHAG
ncbi:D-threo-aldose 1-dehydrogenase [Microbispora rosea]|uniref:D-threo-aldose 1-dehydrogenase n=1 Tax=Microbispora rosea TaxID=58117 RepID=A0A1N7HJK2_9ACTN|nr:aldo/keto reductase [Microbispora rosea]GIH52976.1 oxidoreductase [Microbispora rosea subsp. rosea]SIS24963.1 D-threo-aldose 1-dehydrogenase [Microbispora rosea]